MSADLVALLEGQGWILKSALFNRSSYGEIERFNAEVKRLQTAKKVHVVFGKFGAEIALAGTPRPNLDSSADARAPQAQAGTGPAPIGPSGSSLPPPPTVERPKSQMQPFIPAAAPAPAPVAGDSELRRYKAVRDAILVLLGRHAGHVFDGEVLRQEVGCQSTDVFTTITRELVESGQIGCIRNEDGWSDGYYQSQASPAEAQAQLPPEKPKPQAAPAAESPMKQRKSIEEHAEAVLDVLAAQGPMARGVALKIAGVTSGSSSEKVLDLLFKQKKIEREGLGRLAHIRLATGKTSVAAAPKAKAKKAKVRIPKASVDAKLSFNESRAAQEAAGRAAAAPDFECALSNLGALKLDAPECKGKLSAAHTRVLFDYLDSIMGAATDRARERLQASLR